MDPNVDRFAVAKKKNIFRIVCVCVFVFVFVFVCGCVCVCLSRV